MEQFASDPLPIGPDSDPSQVREAVRAWVKAEVPTAWREAVGRGGLSALRSVRSIDDYEQWYPVFAGSGLVAPTWPREYGGLGLRDALARVAEEELRPYRLGRLNMLGLNLAGPTLLQWGSDDQKERFLRRIVRNEEVWCQLFSEPGAGSDLPSLATQARLEDGEWLLTGQKVWNTWAHRAHFGLVLARTDVERPNREGVTAFALPMQQPGVEVRPLRQMTGDADFNEVYLDDARVPDEFRLGPVNGGWDVARTTLRGERQGFSGPGSGAEFDNLGGRTVSRLWERARDLAADGHSGLADPVVRQRLAKLWSEWQALHWTNLRARDNRRANRRSGAESSIGKLMQTELNQRVQEAWVDLVGMSVISHEADDEDSKRLAYGFLRSRANTIEGGTSEIQRNTLGEQVLGLPREPDPWRGKPWTEIPRSHTPS
jgi:alkylation response protein AidB-like acyl-CoA dehydrogenase